MARLERVMKAVLHEDQERQASNRSRYEINNKAEKDTMSQLQKTLDFRLRKIEQHLNIWAGSIKTGQQSHTRQDQAVSALERRIHVLETRTEAIVINTETILGCLHRLEMAIQGPSKTPSSTDEIAQRVRTSIEPMIQQVLSDQEGLADKVVERVYEKLGAKISEILAIIAE